MGEQDYNRNVISRVIDEALNRQGRGSASRLAHAMNVTPQTVSKWRKGETTPLITDWPQIAAALGLPDHALHDAAVGPDSQAGAARLDVVERHMAEVEAELSRLSESVEEVLRRLERRGRRSGGGGD